MNIHRLSTWTSGCDVAGMPEKETCDICDKLVADEEDGLLCERCLTWKHRECTDMSVKTHQKVSKTKDGWYCYECKNNKQTKITSSQKSKDYTLADVMAKLHEMDLKYECLFRKYEEQVKANETLQHEITEIKCKLNKAEQRGLNNNMIIHGVPYKAGENPEEIITKIGQSLQVPINQHKYSVVRLGGESNKNSPLRVIFENIEMKNIFIRSPKRFQLNTQQLGYQTNQKIFLNHDLTKINLDLLKKTQQFKKENNFKYAWVSNGSILLRKEENSKIVMIEKEEDLANLGIRN